MSVPAPHFLLRARANRHDRPGRWCFMLESGDGSHSLKVEDDEPDTQGERLELLALVRGLEAVPQPARVTLVASSPYVNRVLNGGLDEWRSSGWQWERHGEMVPVKNADLWRRVDRALHFHSVECRTNGNGQRCEGTRIPPPHFPIGASRRQVSSMPVCPTGQAGAPVAATSNQAPDELRRGNVDRPKSLSRNAVAIGRRLRHRFRQTARRWRLALERLAADPEEVHWAD
jgi:ribonuclease HI